MSAARASVSAAEALRLVATGVPLVDVRETDEWDAGHAPQAVLLPLSTLGEHLDDVPEGDEVLVVCRSGVRSARVVAALRQRGVPAVDVVGGMLAWRDAEGELTADEGREATVR